MKKILTLNFILALAGCADVSLSEHELQRLQYESSETTRQLHLNESTLNYEMPLKDGLYQIHYPSIKDLQMMVVLKNGLVNSAFLNSEIDPVYKKCGKPSPSLIQSEAEKLFHCLHDLRMDFQKKNYQAQFQKTRKQDRDAMYGAAMLTSIIVIPSVLYPPLGVFVGAVGIPYSLISLGMQPKWSDGLKLSYGTTFSEVEQQFGKGRNFTSDKFKHGYTAWGWDNFELVFENNRLIYKIKI